MSKSRARHELARFKSAKSKKNNSACRSHTGRMRGGGGGWRGGHGRDVLTVVLDVELSAERVRAEEADVERGEELASTVRGEEEQLAKGSRIYKKKMCGFF